MHIANLGEDALRFIERMPEFAQRDKVIGHRKFIHPIRLSFHNKTSSSRTTAG